MKLLPPFSILVVVIILAGLLAVVWPNSVPWSGAALGLLGAVALQQVPK